MANKLLLGNYPLTVGKFNPYVDVRMGGGSKSYLVPRKDINMRVPDEVRKCVVFLGVQVNTERRYSGTAFLVSLEGETAPLKFMYLVTAKHCADAVEGIEFWIRVNNISGVAEEIQGEGTRWYRHPTDEKHVDAAVCPFLYRPELDCMTIRDTDFFTKQMERGIVGTGDEVFISGLFSLARGSKRNMPIVRMGNIAMIPEDKIPTRSFGDIDAYLIEARSFGGVSGSPVFVRETVDAPSRHGSNVPIHGVGGHYLLGLMHGHWDIDPAALNNPTIRGVDVGVNLGIAIVVPAYKIREVIDHPELAEMRKNLEQQWNAEQRTSKADSTFPERKPTFTKSDFQVALKKASRKVEPKK